jgi:hypothetical protein
VHTHTPATHAPHTTYEVVNVPSVASEGHRRLSRRVVWGVSVCWRISSAGCRCRIRVSSASRAKSSSKSS